MNVVDSLVVNLGFDTSEIEKGERRSRDSMKNVRDDADKTAAELESKGAQAATFFGQIQNKVIGLAAAYVGFEAVKSRLEGVTGATADLGRAAAVSGANIKQLAAFGNLIERNGGNAAAATAQVQGFIQAVERFKVLGQASPELQQFLGTVGAGQNDSWLDILKKFSEYAEKNKADPAKVALIASLGGISDNATVSELLKGPAAFQKDFDRSVALGVAQEKDAAAARELQASFRGLQQAVDTFARDLVTNNAPKINHFFEFLTSWFQGKSGPEHAIGGAIIGGVAGFAFGGPAGAALGALVGAAVGAPFTGPTPSSGPAATPGSVQNSPFTRSSLQLPASATSQSTTRSLQLPASATGPSTSSGGVNPPSPLLPLFRRLEGSGDEAVSPKGAVGRYQVTPDTARTYGLDPSRLKDVAYNTYAASVILNDLAKRYGNDLDAIAAAYHSGPGAADAFLASGRNLGVLGPQGRAYVTHERSLTDAGGLEAGASDSVVAGHTDNSSKVDVHIASLTVVTQAKDPNGVVSAIGSQLSDTILVSNQANAGLR